jgi:hypothetical protein
MCPVIYWRAGTRQGSRLWKAESVTLTAIYLVIYFHLVRGRMRMSRNERSTRVLIRLAPMIVTVHGSSFMDGACLGTCLLRSKQGQVLVGRDGEIILPASPAKSHPAWRSRCVP